MTFQIIPATIQDANEIAALVNSAYRGESSKHGWTTEADLLDGTRTDAAAIKDIIQKPDHTILKYIEQNKILACVELRKEATKMYLGMLTVNPVLQNKGIGKKMLRVVEREAKKQLCKTIYMTVISVRTELIAWYNRHGYSDTEERKPFAFHDPRFGLPKNKLEFVVLEKSIIKDSPSKK